MKVIAINGSPRKNGNTSTLLEHALNGASSNNADTEMIHLYDLSYRGCMSCFACKKIGGKSYGKCVLNDALTAVLDEAAQADVIIVGSPIYLHAETGAMRSFIERLLFPFISYTPNYVSIAPKKIRTGLVYTMNIPEDLIEPSNLDVVINTTQNQLTRVFGSCDVLFATDTYQFDDYSKYVSTVWDAAAKTKRYEEVFPLDCKKAFKMGARLSTMPPIE